MTVRQSQILQAILLLGPTGAGKTPLGDWLEANRLWGRTCHHFDFGANLREIAASSPSDFFSSDEIEFLKRVLIQGVLLEDKSFNLALKILHNFVARHRVQPEHWLILNGLPRHVGQARALESHVQIHAVVQLECDACVVRERLRRDTSGDRTGREDDDEKLVARKLAVYEERTRPLVAYYRERGAHLISIPIGIETQPSEIVQRLERQRRLI